MRLQLAWPARLDHNGRLATIDRDSLEGTAQAVKLTVATQPGERLVSPDFGVADPTFAHVDEADLAAAIARWVPRARVEISVGQPDRDGLQSATVKVTGVE